MACRVAQFPPVSLRLVAVTWAVIAFGATTACFSPEGGSDDAGDDTSSESGGVTGTGSDGDDDGAAESTTAAAGSDADADAVGACAEYCQVVDDHCEGELAQYPGITICESLCARMNPGTPEDTLGNTVGCRTFHALLAAEGPEPHCAHAGPTGAGTCGANCESFCTLALATCEGDRSPWPGAEACIADCEAFDPEPAYSADTPDADTFACRMRHLTLAGEQPEIHCAHIGPASPVCVDA